MSKENKTMFRKEYCPGRTEHPCIWFSDAQSWRWNLESQPSYHDVLESKMFGSNIHSEIHYVKKIVHSEMRRKKKVAFKILFCLCS